MLKDSFVLVTHVFHEESLGYKKQLVNEAFFHHRYVNVKDISDVWKFTSAEQAQKIKGCIGQFFYELSRDRIILEYPCVVILKGDRYYVVHPSDVPKFTGEK